MYKRQEEVFENIYEHTIRYPGQRYVPRNLFIVKQPIRSLMVDTSMDTPQDREIIDKMLERLDISCRELDIFITHDHPDHSGLVQYYACLLYTSRAASLSCPLFLSMTA